MRRENTLNPNDRHNRASRSKPYRQSAAPTHTDAFIRGAAQSMQSVLIKLLQEGGQKRQAPSKYRGGLIDRSLKKPVFMRNLRRGGALSAPKTAFCCVGYLSISPQKKVSPNKKTRLKNKDLLSAAALFLFALHEAAPNKGLAAHKRRLALALTRFLPEG